MGRSTAVAQLRHRLLAASRPAGLFGLLCAGATLLAVGGFQPAADEARSLEAERAYADLPLAFEENAGQAPTRVDYIARTDGASAAISSSGAILALDGKKGSEAIELGLLGASPSEPEALAKLPGEVNYLVGDDQSKWRTSLPTFERVRYQSVYPGIDLLWHGRQDALEYDFRLAPNTDPDRIAMRVEGADDLHLARNGDLVIDADRGSVRQKAPVAYQERGGERIPVDASYRVDGDRVAFDLGSYDRSRPLVIDPILDYSTYLGGNAGDDARAIAVDPTGAAYVTGLTTSADFNTVGPIEGDGGSSDAYISKLNPQGSALVYSTYLGGGASDAGLGIAVDSQGAAYVTGQTDSTDFNTVGSIEGDSAGPDAFVSKLNPAGSALAYSTYLGGNAFDDGEAIAVDSQGAAYVTGFTESTDFNTVGQIEGDSAVGDAYVSKLNPAGSALVYSTYLGGGADDHPFGIAVDSAGAAYVAGDTDSTDFDTVGQIEGDSAARDAFISKLNPAGSALAYSTYLGGNGVDLVGGIAVDSAGSAYVTGLTASTDFNTVGEIEGDSGSSDVYVSKLNPAGSALVYSTYLGGSSVEQGTEIAVDSLGAAYIGGTVDSTDFDTVNEIEGDSPNTDAFVSKLNPAGSALSYSTYLGGSSQDFGGGLAVDADGGAYFTGVTFSTDFDTVEPIEGDSASTDAFISKLVPVANLALSKSDSPDPVREGQELTYSITVTNLGPEGSTGVTVVDALPAGALFASASSGCANAGGTVTCQLGTIQASQTKSVQITVHPTADGTLSNAAAVSAREFDPNSENNADTEQTTVLDAPTCLGRRATIVGTEGADVLDGTAGPDVIVGLGDNDQIAGRGDDDLICPGSDFDTASGGSGDDEFSDSSSSTDTYRGGSGDDTFTVGGDPSLKVSGGDGADILTVSSASTASSVDLGSGPDQVKGPLSGKVLGGDDADLLVAHAAANGPLQGGPGDDTLQGSGSADDLRGEGGSDTLTGKGDVDLLQGGGGGDQITAGGGAESGANAIRGGDGNDELRGGGGADELFGEVGDDALFGEDDPDFLSGGTGTDSCAGGGGADSTDGSCETTVGVP